MGRQQLYLNNIDHVSGQQHTYMMPKGKGISTIIIREHGAVGACTTYVANTWLESIRVRIGNKLAIDWGGRDDVAGAISYGMMALRDYYKMQNKITCTAEQFIIQLPDAIPKNTDIQLILKLAAYASMGCNADDFTGTYDILYEIEDKIKGAVVVPKIQWGNWNDAALTGHRLHYLPAVPFKLRCLILITEDSDTPADDTYETLTIEMDGEIYYDGELSSLGTQFEKICKVAHTTGIFYLYFPDGIKIPSESFKMDFYASAAGTLKRIHWWTISY